MVPVGTYKRKLQGILEMPDRIIAARGGDLANYRACISPAHFRLFVLTDGTIETIWEAS
jgi:hypothetical protein